MSYEEFITKTVTLLGELAERLDIKDPYFGVNISVDNHKMPTYTAHFSFGDRMNDRLIFTDTNAESLHKQITQYMENKDTNSVRAMYHQKRIESNKATIKFHEKELARLDKT